MALIHVYHVLIRRVGGPKTIPNSGCDQSAMHLLSPTVRCDSVSFLLLNLESLNLV